jgi:hypothetical protein
MGSGLIVTTRELRDEIIAMLRKQAEAHAMNMDLNESDKMHLLDLLLTERTGGQYK